VATIAYITGSKLWNQLIDPEGDIISGDEVGNYYSTLITFLLRYGLSQEYTKNISCVQSGCYVSSYSVPDPKEAKAYRALFSNVWYVDSDGNLVDKSRANEEGVTSYTMQGALQTVIGLVFGLDQETREKASGKLSNIMSCIDGLIGFYFNAIGNWNYSNRDLDFKNEYKDTIWKAIEKTDIGSVIGNKDKTDASGKIIELSNFSKLKQAFPVVFDMLMSFLSYDYRLKSYDGGSNDNHLLGTLAYNSTAVATQHYPEVNFAWLRAQDSLYKDDYTGFSTSQHTFAKPAAPKFTQASGSVFSESTKLEMKDDTDGAEILYTVSTNGTSATPTVETLGNTTRAYGEYIGLSSTYGTAKVYTITAVAYKDGAYSDPVTGTFTIATGAVQRSVTIYDNGNHQTQSYYPGETVTLSASNSEDSDFTSWTVSAGGAVLTDSSKSVTTFVMPKRDVTVTANRVSKINSIHIQFNTAGTVNNEMYMDEDYHRCNTANWYVGNGNNWYASTGYTGTMNGTTVNSYNTARVGWSFSDGELVAQLYLPALEDTADSKAPQYKTGTEYTVESNPSPSKKLTAEAQMDGSMLIRMYFDLNKSISDISYPEEIVLAHDSTADTASIISKAQATNPTAEVTCKNGSVLQSAITLDTAATDKEYDPSAFDEQTITVIGKIDTEKDHITLTGTDYSSNAAIKIRVLAADKTPAVSATPANSTSTSDINVELSSDGSEHIYYTLDGSDPTDANNTARKEYTAALTMTGTEGKKSVTVLRTYAVKAGCYDSEVSSYFYTVNVPAESRSVTVTNGCAKDSSQQNVISNAKIGETVVLQAEDAADGTKFTGWTITSENVTLTDPTAAVTAFTMPAEAVEVKANYQVSSLNLTMAALESGNALPSSVTGLDGNIFNTNRVSIAWTPNDSAVKNDTGYTAAITVPLKTGTDLLYSDAVIALVNGNGAAVKRISDTEVQVIYQFAGDASHTVTVQKQIGNDPAADISVSKLDDGTEITIPCMNDTDNIFTEWSVSPAAAVYTVDGKTNAISLTMPDEDITIIAKYTKKKAVSTADVKLSSPTAYKDLPNDASTETQGISISEKWMNIVQPAYKQSCTAVLTLTPNAEYKFTSSSEVNVSNGTVKNTVLNSDGTLTVYVLFTTAKAKLTDISFSPEKGTYKHDTNENIASAITSNLAQAAILTYKDGRTETAAITWIADTESAYDDSKGTEQTVKYVGTVAIPSYVDLGEISSAIKYSASVSALQTLKIPAASLKSGTYTEEQTLSLSSSEGGTIYYTADGSDPTDKSNEARKLYAGEIAVSGKAGKTVTTEINAYALKDGYNPSKTTKLTYSITLPMTYTVTVNNGTYVNQTAAGSSVYHAGDTVLITAKTAEEGRQFSGWKVNSGNAVLTDSSRTITAFTMPAEDVEITAQYQTIITNYDFTIDSAEWIPVKGSSMKRSASVKFNNGTETDDAAITWRPALLKNNIADGGTAYTAVINVTPPSDSYVFGSSVVGTINGNAASVFANSDGSLTFTYTFAKTSGNSANELYGVTVQGYDADTGNLLSEETHEIGSFKAGETVKANATDVSGMVFAGWTAEKEDGTAISNLVSSSESLSFAMPTYAVKLKANYRKKQEIASAEIAIAVPAANTALSKTVSSNTEGIESLSLVWTNIETPGYGETRLAAIKVEADSTHTFSSTSLTAANVTVSGAQCIGIDFNDDGSITVYASFTTEKAKITSITWNEGTYIVPRGTSAETMLSMLPKTALLVLEDGKTVSVPVQLAQDGENPLKFTCTVADTSIPAYAVAAEGLSLTRTITFAYEDQELPTLAAPKFAYSSQTGIVILDGNNAECTIYYEVTMGETENGPENPTLNSTAYTSPIQIFGDKGTTVTCWIKAYAVGSGYQDSKVSEQKFTYTIPSTYTVKVNCYDLNLKSVIESRSYTYTSGDSVSLISPTVEDETFYGWMESGTEFNSSVQYPEFTMGNEDVTLTAAYVPVVNKIATSVTDPVMGSELSTEVGQTTASITNTYEINPDSMQVEWEPSEVAADAYGRSFTAKITLKTDKDGKIQIRRKGTAEWSGTVPMFSLSDGCVFTVNGQKAVLYAENGQFVGYYTVKTADAVLAEAPSVGNIQTDYSNGTAKSAFDLPRSVDVRLTDGNTVSVPVTWEYGADYDSYITLQQSVPVTGTAVLPDYISNPNGYSLTFNKTLTVNQGAIYPVTADLESGTSYTNSQFLKLETESENATIHYTVSGGSYTGEELTCSSGDSILLKGTAGQRTDYFVTAWAVRLGGLTSDETVFNYSIELPNNIPVAADTAIDCTEQMEFSQQLTAPSEDVNAPAAVWSVSGGSTLPDGVKLDEQGMLSGTPKDAGTYTFYVTAANIYGSDIAKITMNIAQTTYLFTKGMDETWTQGSVDEMYAETNGSIKLLKYVTVDGTELDSETDYRTKEGSTKIWIKPAYLRKLSVGKHTLRVYYKGHDEEVSMTFTVKKAGSTEIVSTDTEKDCQKAGYPSSYKWDDKTKSCRAYSSADTGDSDVMTWIALFGICSTVILLCGMALRKKH
jgi:hypothetical protein